jgi:hypothetical protein
VIGGVRWSLRKWRRWLWWVAVWSKRVRVGVGDRWCEMVLEEADEVAVVGGESVGSGFPSLKRFEF